MVQTRRSGTIGMITRLLSYSLLVPLMLLLASCSSNSKDSVATARDVKTSTTGSPRCPGGKTSPRTFRELSMALKASGIVFHIENKSELCSATDVAYVVTNYSPTTTSSIFSCIIRRHSIRGSSRKVLVRSFNSNTSIFRQNIECTTVRGSATVYRLKQALTTVGD